jgi:hypothetical protein
MPRKKRSLDRDAGVLRDASLIIIASEDTYAVKDYFSRFRTRKVQFVVIPTLDCRSSPEAVLDRLDQYHRENATEEGDQFWICIDQDHWAEPGHIANLTSVLRECRQKGYRVAISNPCFELWMLLHFTDFVGGTPLRCEQVTEQLALHCGGYTKNTCHRIALTGAMVHQAVKRAKALELGDRELPDGAVTRVYKIVEELVSKDSLDLS